MSDLIVTHIVASEFSTPSTSKKTNLTGFRSDPNELLVVIVAVVAVVAAVVVVCQLCACLAV